MDNNEAHEHTINLQTKLTEAQVEIDRLTKENKILTLKCASSLEDELGAVINRYSQEQASNTPDFILAQYLIGCLAAWNTAVQQRETWYGRDARPCHIAMKEAAFDGEYVLYEDHLAVVAEKDREIERLTEEHRCHETGITMERV